MENIINIGVFVLLNILELVVIILVIRFIYKKLKGCITITYQKPEDSRQEDKKMESEQNNNEGPPTKVS